MLRWVSLLVVPLAQSNRDTPLLPAAIDFIFRPSMGEKRQFCKKTQRKLRVLSDFQKLF